LASSEEEQFLTTKHVAQILNRSSQAVQGYYREGKLPALKTFGGMRLFKLTDVQAFARKYLHNEAGALYPDTAKK
jgi:excisionase family DNA binding protein